ncbi:MAG: polyhydroxyalkanoate depolymerase [Sphingobacteriia bacterium]|nr:polyhydroxyalkanoate depolymerase [Sphingobacteriia bacterium]
MYPLFENSLLYTYIEFARKNIVPLRNGVNLCQSYLASPFNLIKNTDTDRALKATLEMYDRMFKVYKKPEFGIQKVKVDGKDIKIQQETLLYKSFCNLIHFKKLDNKIDLPKMLIVAPLSGHHATLLRGTVEDTLPFFDVYITDWKDASQIPVAEGKFDLEDYTKYVIEFIKFLGPNLSVMAVCQPTVPVVAAISLLEEEKYTGVDNMVLIGGPVDARESSTEVNQFAENRPMNWFETQVITRVPFNYPGFLRPVYPGFIQLFGFMAMNMQRHIGEHMKLYQHLIIGDGESAEKQKDFYDEYLAVLDMPAEFYLQTIKSVFKDFALPRGKMKVDGKLVKPELIYHSAILAIEGELDDISGIGQTKAALKICKNVPKEKTHYHFQEGVGHYGVFNGRKFREKIVPVIKDFCYKHTGYKKTI